MDLTQYRDGDIERKRTEDLVRLFRVNSNISQNALDVGARDGHFSRLLEECFRDVTALDLEKPSISHKNIFCVQGDITSLDFNDNSFDLVFCAEVLEHIPSHLLEKACFELSRVCKEFLLIGVPYKQDIRVGRTTCYSCGKKNPPWGHVNNFDRRRLTDLFPSLNAVEVSFIGETDVRTNIVSTFLMDLAGNPYGTYTQEEACIRCGKKLKSPPEGNLLQKISARVGSYLASIQKPILKAHPNWIHVLFKKPKA